MKFSTEEGFLVITLSRRNLLTLLAKLDGYPPMSACMIEGGSEASGVRVRAEEDHVHYINRKPGRMHEWTEKRIKKEYLLREETSL